MTTIISIKGQNTRMGKLFKTPKHYLLHNGSMAIRQTVTRMQEFGPVWIVANENDDEIDFYSKYWFVDRDTFRIIKQGPDNGIVDMLLQMDLPNQFFVVDCDVIPITLTQPKGNTVYLFKNKNELTHYSNYKLFHGKVLECNEKQEVFDWAGAGVYYFDRAPVFKYYADGCTTLAQVISKMIGAGESFHGNTDSEIFRFGSLQTILNNDVHELGV